MGLQQKKRIAVGPWLKSSFLGPCISAACFSSSYTDRGLSPPTEEMEVAAIRMCQGQAGLLMGPVSVAEATEV